MDADDPGKAGSALPDTVERKHFGKMRRVVSSRIFLPGIQREIQE